MHACRQCNVQVKRVRDLSCAYYGELVTTSLFALDNRGSDEMRTAADTDLERGLESEVRNELK